MSEGLLRVTGYTSFGHVGCLRALVTYLLGFAGLLGMSLVTLWMPQALVGPTLVGAVVLLLIVLVPTEYFRRHGPVVRDAELMLDEGGVRLTVGRSRRYLPLARAELALESGGVRVGGRRRIELFQDAQAAVEQLVAELARRRDGQAGDDEPALRRADSDLVAWSERVTRFVQEQRSEAGYRTADRWHDERLLAMLSDRAQRPTMRAAAGHALLRVAPARAAAARAACSAATPPIVVAMLYAAAPDAFGALFERIAPFLPRRDRRDAERLAATTRRSGPPRAKLK